MSTRKSGMSSRSGISTKTRLTALLDVIAVAELVHKGVDRRARRNERLSTEFIARILETNEGILNAGDSVETMLFFIESSNASKMTGDWYGKAIHVAYARKSRECFTRKNHWKI
jgi:hypothetical protein